MHGMHVQLLREPLDLRAQLLSLGIWGPGGLRATLCFELSMFVFHVCDEIGEVCVVMLELRELLGELAKVFF